MNGIDKNVVLLPLVEELVDLKTQIGQIEGSEIPDTAFAKRFLSFSSTTWSRLQRNDYAGGPEKIAEKMRQDIAAIKSKLPLIQGAQKFAQGFVQTTMARAVDAAINRAKTSPDGRRVVVVLAPTGHGKSMIAKYHASRGALMVEGRQAWRNSYRAFCSDVLQAARKAPASDRTPEYKLEARMIDALSSKDGTLFIDEANTMSAASANAIKTIVNRTGYTVVIAAIPAMWDKLLGGARDEVLQLVNRCQPVIRAERISTEDVAQFLKTRGAPSSDVKRVANAIAGAANRFGGFRTVTSMVNSLSDLADYSDEAVAKELRRFNQDLHASGVGQAD